MIQWEVISIRNKIYLKEWEKSRDLIKEYDDRIHDLRKYGFSFLTALIAAESLLIPGDVTGVFGQASIPDFTKLVIMLITFLLIITLRVIERNYRLFIKCAAERARIIERNLNLELTVIISDRHRAEGIGIYENSIYFFFTIGVYGLGTTVLFPNLLLIRILLFLTLVTIIIIAHISILTVKRERGKVDWTVDPVECKKGEKVKIILTNLDWKNYRTLSKGKLVWEIKTQDGKLIHEEKMKEEVVIRNQEDLHIWQWDTSKVEKGIYKIFPLIPDEWKNIPLGRNIIVN